MIHLFKWGKGVGFEPHDAPDMKMYLWFYEWNLFDAVKPGEHNHGRCDFHKDIGEDRSEARLHSPHLELKAKAAEDGAQLTIVATNGAEHDWGEEAAIIPCFNPGDPRGKLCSQNPLFADEEQTRTYFLGENGLAPLVGRDIHFNRKLRAQVEALSDNGEFSFSGKWPTSEQNAYAGIMVRESSDGQWVAAIAWEDFLSSQGHNPWKCMHLSARLGPLKPGESRTLRGRVYLFRGDRNDCLERFQKEFSA